VVYKCVAGAGVNVVESKQAGGAGIQGVQTESQQPISDLRHLRSLQRIQLMPASAGPFVPETHLEDTDFPTTGTTVITPSPSGRGFLEGSFTLYSIFSVIRIKCLFVK
jgi:hypothetical protein